MTLSKREKILLIISGILLISFLIYNFVLLPQFKKLNELENESEKLEKDLLDSKESIDSIENSDEKIDIKTNEIKEITDNLFPSLQQNEILLLLDKFIKESNIKIQGINFSEIVLSPIQNNEINESIENDNKFNNIINKYKNLTQDNYQIEKEDNESEIKEDQVIAIENISATVIYSGNYNELIDFLSYINDFEKNIIIKDITVIETNEGVSGDIVLNFYGIPKINQLDQEFIELPNNNINGKNNPFQS